MNKITLKINYPQLSSLIGILNQCYKVIKYVKMEGFGNVMVQSMVDEIMKSLLNKAMNVDKNVSTKKFTISFKLYQAAIIYEIISGEMLPPENFPVFPHYTENVRTMITMDLHKQLSNQQTNQ